MQFKNLTKLDLMIIIFTLSIAILFVGCGEHKVVEVELPPAGNISPLEGFTSQYISEDYCKVNVYVPYGFEFADTTVKYPVVYLLHGFGGDESWFKNWTAIQYLLDEMIAEGTIAPMIVVMPNGNNPLGGSFYTNSDFYGDAVFGYYEYYLVGGVAGDPEGLIWYFETESEYKDKVYGDNAHRAISGISMGGYGAMKLAMKYPQYFNSVSCHSAPLYFDLLTGFIPVVLLEGNGEIDYSPTNPLTCMMFAMAGAFTPYIGSLSEFDEDPYKFPLSESEIPGIWIGVELPFDTTYQSIEDLNPEIWAKWLAHDPKTMVASYGELMSAEGLYVYLDCGDQDDFGLNLHLNYPLGDTDFYRELKKYLDEEHLTYYPYTGRHVDHLYDRLIESFKYHSERFGK